MLISDIVAKKRDGKELSWEEIEFFINGIGTGKVREAQTGAMVMAMHLCGITDIEMELLMKAMLFSGETLHWPAEWVGTLTCLQSTGSTGNKAKLVLAPIMAACGLRFPIMPARGYDMVGGILNKLRTLPGFQAKYEMSEIENMLADHGCCAVVQPKSVAPAERVIRDVASLIGTFHNNSLKAACMIARISALKLEAAVIEVTCGPGESIKSKTEAQDLVQKMQELIKVMGLKCKVLLTKVDGPVGMMVGQSLEISEAIRCLSGDGPKDFHELVSKLGSHILHTIGVVKTLSAGQDKIDKVIKDGTARRRFTSMLASQGVDKSDVKSMFKHHYKDENMMPSILPVAKYFTHLSTVETGFVHKIDTSKLNFIMNELARETDPKHVCAGGVQLLVQVGSYLNRGEVWAKVHHNIRLTEDQTEQLRLAITLKLDTPLYDMTIDISEFTPVTLPKESEELHVSG